MRKPLIAANWKLNGDLALCRQFAEAFAGGEATAHKTAPFPDVVVCPPAVYIPLLAEESGRKTATFAIGAQNVAREQHGAYTGEISAPMLAEAGARYSIVGHSERRALFGETDTDVLMKSQALVANGIAPIICVGESLAHREAGSAEDFVTAQLQAVFEQWGGVEASQLVLAYEPIWAIGTGVSATAEQVQAMHNTIRQCVAAYLESDAVRLLYGGSVKAANASELLALPDVDGALVGGASLQVDEFRQIIAAA